MKYLLPIVLLLGGCLNSEYAADYKPGQGPRVVVSTRLISEPNPITLNESSIDGTDTAPATRNREAKSTKPEKSDAEVEMEISLWLMGTGMFFVIAGLVLMWARRYPGVALIAPTWGPKVLFGIGAGLVVYGGATGMMRNVVLAIVAGVILIWMWRGSNIHNKVMSGKVL